MEMVNFPEKAVTDYETGHFIGSISGRIKCPRNGCEKNFFLHPAQLDFPWATNGGKYIKISRFCSCGCRIVTVHDKKTGGVVRVIIKNK